ncbi:MAG TPA: DUF4352 domain-containing protein [Blastocatellia bacterium]|nr:DUF4352 domain-containing protein [Blastocatellia bacterium]
MERDSRGIAVTVAIVAAIGISLLAMLAVMNRRDQIVGLNEDIQYDDFAFSVLAVREAHSLGSAEYQTNAQGVYWIVTLKIVNHAKRVDYKFKRSSPVLIEASGRELRPSAIGQQALESVSGLRCSKPIPAGASCTTEVVFDVPANARVSSLRISEGGLAGDILEVIFFGKKRIELGTVEGKLLKRS